MRLHASAAGTHLESQQVEEGGCNVGQPRLRQVVPARGAGRQVGGRQVKPEQLEA